LMSRCCNAGNPIDRGGYWKNMQHLLQRGLVPDSFEARYAPYGSSESLAPLQMGDVPVKDTSNFDRFGCAGTLPNKLTGIGLEVLESAEAFRWVITQLQRIQEDRHLTPLECDNRVQILRDLMLETVVHLASYPPTKQKRLLAILNGHEYQQVIAAGHIADQLLSAKAVLPQDEGAKNGIKTFEQPSDENLHTGVSQSHSSPLASVDNSSSKAAMQEFMLEQQRVIAQEVLTTDQLEIFMEGQKQMDLETDPKEKQRVMLEAQRKLAHQLTDLQQDKIRTKMQAKMNEWHEREKNI